MFSINEIKHENRFSVDSNTMRELAVEILEEAGIDPDVLSDINPEYANDLYVAINAFSHEERARFLTQDIIDILLKLKHPGHIEQLAGLINTLQTLPFVTQDHMDRVLQNPEHAYCTRMVIAELKKVKAATEKIINPLLQYPEHAGDFFRAIDELLKARIATQDNINRMAQYYRDALPEIWANLRDIKNPEQADFDRVIRNTGQTRNWALVCAHAATERANKESVITHSFFKSTGGPLQMIKEFAGMAAPTVLTQEKKPEFFGVLMKS